PRTRLQTQEAPSEKPQRHEDHRDSRPAISVLLASLWFFAIARSSRGGSSASCRFVASFLVCAVADEFDFGDAGVRPAHRQAEFQTRQREMEKHSYEQQSTDGERYHANAHIPLLVADLAGGGRVSLRLLCCTGLHV